MSKLAARVRSHTRKPSFSNNSLAIRSSRYSPNEVFSRAILKIGSWRSGGIRGGPAWSRAIAPNFSRRDGWGDATARLFGGRDQTS
jgi:hypothetical protein